MMFRIRAYQGYDDLQRIQNLMRDGMRAYPHSYMHPGDVEWWLFYNPSGETPQESAFLWEDAAGSLLGWVLTTQTFVEYEVYPHPSMRGSALEAHMVDWAEDFLKPYINREDPNIEIGCVFADHTSLHEVLRARGYHLRDYLAYFVQDLRADLPPAPALPPGYEFLPRMDISLAAPRAYLHKQAFSSTSRMTPEYYRQFMAAAPMYDPAHDVVLCGPDGSFVAFAMTWPDYATGRGEFEPVGTHPEYQRRGLGRATMQEGLRRLKMSGMTLATVCTGAEQQGNIAFYEACGFTRVNTVLRGTKKSE